MVALEGGYDWCCGDGWGQTLLLVGRLHRCLGKGQVLDQLRHPGSRRLVHRSVAVYLSRIPPVASRGWAQGPLRRAFAFSPVAWAMQGSASDLDLSRELASCQVVRTDCLDESGPTDIDKCAAGLPGMWIDQADG